MPEAVKSRSAVTRFFGEILDSTKTLTDDLNDTMNDMLDNGEKLQRSVRNSTRRIVDIGSKDDEEDRGSGRRKLAEPDTPTRRTAP